MLNDNVVWVLCKEWKDKRSYNIIVVRPNDTMIKTYCVHYFSSTQNDPVEEVKTMIRQHVELKNYTIVLADVAKVNTKKALQFDNNELTIVEED